MRRFILSILPAIVIQILAADAIAHEVKPAYLQITQTAQAEFDVLWKQPTQNGRRLRLNPRFPEACQEDEPSLSRAPGNLLRSSKLYCDLDEGAIVIDGLERTLTDVFVEITYLNQPRIISLLKPASPSFMLGASQHTGFIDYLIVGVEHIIFGWDHIFFVIGLTLLISLRQIWMVATSFTIAHSLTLALVAFGMVSIPIRPVEILIALSIVLLGIEILRHKEHKASMITKHPYSVSFLIGLLHGCGFASAFGALGISQGGRLTAILPFNLGIELGQFAVIAVTSLGIYAVARRYARGAEWLRRGLIYTISGIAMFWVIERAAYYVI